MGKVKKEEIVEDVTPDFPKPEQYKKGFEFCGSVEKLAEKQVRYVKRCKVDKRGNPKACRMETIVEFPDGTSKTFEGLWTEAKIDEWFLKKCGCDCVRKDVARTTPMRR